MTSIEEVLARLGGVATRSELLSVMSRKQLDAAVHSGAVVRPRRGRYCAPAVDDALALAHEMSAVVGLRSAALAHGWKVREPPRRPELIVPRGRKVSAEDAKKAHFRRSALTVADQQRGVTTPLRTVLDCARALPLDEALPVADSALRSGQVTRRDLDRAADAVRGAGRTKARFVLDNATHLATGPFESALRAIALGVRGLKLVPQVWVEVVGRDTDSMLVRPDLVDTELRLVVEADSHEHHTKRQQLTTDCWRYDELVLAGWIVLRFSWEQVMFEADWVRSVLVRAVELARRTHKVPIKR